MELLPTGSVTRLYGRSQSGDSKATAALLERLSPIIHAYCLRQFRRNASAVKSAADFANEAMVSFHDSLTRSKLQVGWNRQDLAALLITIAWRKQLQHRRAEVAAKRGAGKVLQVSALNGADALDYHAAVSALEPEMLDASCAELLDMLPEDLRFIAIRRFQRYELRDIGHELNCHVSSVKRKLSLIRAKWKDVLQ